MPLRDHFPPPVSKLASWEGLHGQWPAMIVQQLSPVLPDGYAAEPLWLTADLSVPLDLEASYEDACRLLRIP